MDSWNIKKWTQVQWMIEQLKMSTLWMNIFNCLSDDGWMNDDHLAWMSRRSHDWMGWNGLCQPTWHLWSVTYRFQIINLVIESQQDTSERSSKESGRRRHVKISDGWLMDQMTSVELVNWFISNTCWTSKGALIAWTNHIGELSTNRIDFALSAESAALLHFFQFASSKFQPIQAVDIKTQFVPNNWWNSDWKCNSCFLQPTCSIRHWLSVRMAQMQTQSTYHCQTHSVKIH